MKEFCYSPKSYSEEILEAEIMMNCVKLNEKRIEMRLYLMVGEDRVIIDKELIEAITKAYEYREKAIGEIITGQSGNKWK